MSDNKLKILFFVIITSIFIVMGIIGSFFNEQAKTESLLTTALTIPTTAGWTTETTTEESEETSANHSLQTTAFSYYEATSQSDPATDASSSAEKTVYIGKSGNKYHNKDCSTLKGNGNAISVSEAIAQGRTPCKICKP